jgi:PAS domain S-box-containing protein
MSPKGRLSALSGVAGEVLCLRGPDARVIEVSDSVREVLGYDPAEYRRLDPFDLVHPDDRAEAEKRWHAVVATVGASDRWELRIRRADGSFAWVDSTAVNATDDPEVGSIVTSCRDITERRTLEDALRASESRLRMVVEHSRDVAALLDQSGTIVWVGPKVTEMLAFDPDDLLGSSGFALVHPDDLMQAVERFAESLQPEQPDPITIRMSTKDGDWKPIEVAGAPWPMDDGNVGLIVNLRDVEWRARSERALRESEELFRSLADSSPTGIYRALPNGDCVYVNERWQEITGYTAEEALGMGWRRMLHPDDRSVVESREGYIRETLDQLHLELRVVRPDGTVRWISIDSAPFRDSEGQFAGTVGTIQDITDRVIAQRESERLTDIFEATNDVVAIADRSGKLLYLNSAARRFFGLPVDA